MTEKTLKLENTPFIEEIVDDLNNKEKGRFMIVTGGVGEGKSMMAARLAELVDSSFDIDHIAIAKTSVFIKLLSKAANGEFKSGTAIMLDEAGCGIGSREWNTAQNRVLSLIFQIMRKLGLFVILTVPAKAMIDISAQRLAKNYASAKGVDYIKKRSYFKIFNILYNDWDDELWHSFLKDENGEKINLWSLSLPIRLDIEEYEKRKDESIQWLFKRAEMIFEQIESDDEGNGHSGKARRSATKVAEELIIEDAKTGSINYLSISKETDISIKSLTSIVSALKKAGIVVE